MINRDGQVKTRLPTQFRTKKSKKKVLKQEGEKFNYEITKCVVCNKRKMERYDLKDTKGDLLRINKCTNCKYTNASEVIAYNSDGDDPYAVNYFKPKPLEDKS